MAVLRRWVFLSRVISNYFTFLPLLSEFKKKKKLYTKGVKTEWCQCSPDSLKY